MADTKVYVNTDSSGGTNGSTNASGVAFPSLNAALTYAAANKGAGDKWTIIVSAPTGVADLDTSLGDLSGIATNATGYLHVRPNRGNEGGTVPDQRSYGAWSTAIYRFSYTNNFTINGQYCYFTDLQLFAKGTGALPPNGPYLTANNAKFERGIVYADPSYAGNGSSGNNIGIRGSGSTAATIVCNSIIIGFNVATAYTPGLGVLCVSGKYLNLSVVNCRRGFYFSNVCTIKNCLGYGSVTNDWDGGGWTYATTATNASEDATAPGTGALPNKTFTFENAAGIDFTLKTTDTGATGLGTDLGNGDDWTDVDGNLNGPRVSIEGVTRSTTWSVGASESAGGGGGGGGSTGGGNAGFAYQFLYGFGDGTFTPQLSLSGYWGPTPNFLGRPVRHVAHTGNNATSGDALQAAMDEEATLDRNVVITLDPGVVYDGAYSGNAGFRATPHTSTRMIDIVTVGIESGDPSLPAYGEQVQISDAANLAELSMRLVAGARGCVVWFPDGTHYWGLRGVRVAPSVTHRFGLVCCGGDPGIDPGAYGGTWANHTSHIAIDRVLMDTRTTQSGGVITGGHHFQNSSGAIVANGRQLHVRGCYVRVSDIVGQGDYKCFEAYHAADVLVEDCEFFRGGEIVFLGGGGVGDSYGFGAPLTRFLFRRCWLHKDHDQMKAEGWLSKNGVETKGSTHVRFEGCLIDAEQTISGDTSQQYLLTGVTYPTDSGGDPVFMTFSHWEYVDCVIRRGYSLHLNRAYNNETGHAAYANQTPSHHLTFDNVLIGGFSQGAGGGGGWLLWLINWHNLTMRHVTIDVREPDGSERYNAPFQFVPGTTDVGDPPAIDFTGFSLTDSIVVGAYRQFFSNNSSPDSTYRYNHTFWTTYLQPFGAALSKVLWASNAASDDVGTYTFVPEFGTADGDSNWRLRDDNWPTTVFENATAATGLANYRVKVGSGYAAGEARCASDGKALGVDWTRMQTTMGPTVWAAAGY